MIGDGYEGKGLMPHPVSNHAVLGPMCGESGSQESVGQPDLLSVGFLRVRATIFVVCLHRQ